MATAESKTKLIVDIPTDLKKDFKLYCIVNEVAMTEVIETLVRGLLEEQKLLEGNG